MRTGYMEDKNRNKDQFGSCYSGTKHPKVQKDKIFIANFIFKLSMLFGQLKED